MSLATATYASFEPRVIPHAMRGDHTPTNGIGYWIALSIASVVGCNGGDLFAATFGTLAGLPLLAAGFGASLWAERRSTRPTQAYYWAAILLVRVAATNVADFLGHAIGPAALTAVGAVLAATFAVRAPVDRESAKFPTVDSLYWARMMLVGTLGTALGDYSSFMSGLGLNMATLALGASVAALVALRSFGLLAFTAAYWSIVVVIRIAGTALGDLSAGHLGLTQSGAVWAMVLLAVLFFRTKRPEVLTAAIA